MTVYKKYFEATGFTINGHVVTAEAIERSWDYFHAIWADRLATDDDNIMKRIAAIADALENRAEGDHWFDRAAAIEEGASIAAP